MPISITTIRKLAKLMRSEGLNCIEYEGVKLYRNATVEDEPAQASINNKPLMLEQSSQLPDEQSQSKLLDFDEYGPTPSYIERIRRSGAAL